MDTEADDISTSQKLWVVADTWSAGQLQAFANFSLAR
jgi:hypothetical protein